jgi:hypothetical protein
VRAWQSENGSTNIPAFKSCVVSTQQLCNSEDSARIKLQLMNYNHNGTHGTYGFAITSLAEMRSKGSSFTYSLQDQTGKSSGVLRVSPFQFVEKPNFLDYLRSGWFINMAVAVDFTASNGEQMEPNCLHKQYNQPNMFNDYEKGILSVGQVLEPYAFETKFAAFGFGGVPRFAGQNSVSHCFNLTGRPDPSVQGLNGLFTAYKTAIMGTSLSGPTYFGPILETLRIFINQNMNMQMYHTLVIFTDGAIHDFSQVVDLIVEMSNLPLSIIIVGIGSANFGAMETLDGDEQRLRSSRGVMASRDIV